MTDAYFVKWTQDTGDTQMKKLFYPNLDKDVLYHRRYITELSSHTRGNIVDLTLIDMAIGKDVDMGNMFFLQIEPCRLHGHH